MSSNSAKSIVAVLAPYAPLLIILYLLQSYYRAWNRLRNFKGPWTAAFSYLFMARTAASGKMNLIYTDVNRKYGPLARVGPNDLMTDDPDIIRRMGAARSTYKRSNWYEAMRMDPYVDSILSEMDVGIHDARRAKMAAAYQGKENPTLEPDIDAQITAFISLIRTKYLSEGAVVKPMDFGKKAQFFTLDVITKVAYGDAFGYLEKDEDVHEYIETTEALVPFLTFFAVVPLANAILNRSWVKQKVGPGPDDKSGLGKLMGVARQVASQRFGPNKKERQDMLGAFVRNGISQRQIESEILLQIIAGSDTTATVVRATFLNLLTHPRVLANLRRELELAEREGRMSSPISNAEAKALPYLQAVVHEGLRMHPPFTGLVMKQVPPGGDTIKGQYVPGGTKIGHSTWAVQRRSDIYSDDVDVFRPERWLEADEERRLRMEQCLDLVFGYGRWGCLGKTVAWIELNKVYVELLRHFDFEILNPEKPWRSVNYNLFMQDEMWLRVMTSTGVVRLFVYSERGSMGRNRNRNRNRKKKDSAGSSSAGQTTSPAASTTNNTTAGVNDDAAPTSTGTAHANFDRSDNDQDGCLNSEQGTRDPTSCEEATSTESGRLSELTNRLQLSLTQRLVLEVLLQRFVADDLRCTMARIMLLSLTCANAQKSRLIRDTADEYGIRMMKMIALAHSIGIEIDPLDLNDE